jgi:hypothetical protein
LRGEYQRIASTAAPSIIKTDCRIDLKNKIKLAGYTYSYGFDQ